MEEEKVPYYNLSSPCCTVFKSQKRHKYIQNLLCSTDTDSITNLIAKFIIEDQNREYYLEFQKVPMQYNDLDFNLFDDLEAAKIELELSKNKNRCLDDLIAFKNEMIQSKRLTSITIIKFSRLVDLFELDRSPKLFKKIATIKNLNESNLKSYNREDLAEFVELLDKIVQTTKSSMATNKEVEFIYKELQDKKDLLTKTLQNDDLMFLTKLSDSKVLLLKTDMIEAQLNSLPNKVYLAAPASQVFLFLDEDLKSSIFSSLKLKNKTNQYSEHVNLVKNDLSGFFTYDFSTTDQILDAFELAVNEDRKIKIQTNSYGDHFDKLSSKLNNFLDGKNITTDPELTRVIFKLNNCDKELKAEDLSHGELKKLSLYIWLKYVVEKDSIVLMDEVDMALHPKWQYELINDLKNWSETNQYLLATHSPQILSSTHYKNIIRLVNIDGFSSIERLNRAPVDRDINSIISTIMDAPSFPIELLVLHKQYRKLVEQGRVNSSKAITLKNKILDFESEDSQFFQEIQFDLDLI